MNNTGKTPFRDEAKQRQGQWCKTIVYRGYYKDQPDFCSRSANRSGHCHQHEDGFQMAQLMRDAGYGRTGHNSVESLRALLIKASYLLEHLVEADKDADLIIADLRHQLKLAEQQELKLAQQQGQ